MGPCGRLTLRPLGSICANAHLAPNLQLPWWSRQDVPSRTWDRKLWESFIPLRNTCRVYRGLDYRRERTDTLFQLDIVQICKTCKVRAKYLGSFESALSSTSDSEYLLEAYSSYSEDSWAHRKPPCSLCLYVVSRHSIACHLVQASPRSHSRSPQSRRS